MNKAVFLDRDGTINVEKNYLYKIQDWEWEDRAIEAIRGFNEMGFLVIVVSNQAGIAKRYYNENDVKILHNYVQRELQREKAKINKFYYCPHHPDITGKCTCRKPDAGMILKAKEEFDIDLGKSYIIGDKAIDIETGIRSGLSPILVLTGYGFEERYKVLNGITVVENIFMAYQYIKNQNLFMYKEKLI